jgi:hypothetical protein
MDFPTNDRVMADQIFEKYLKAIGGAGALAKVTSLTAKGTYSGFDTGHAEVPVEIFAKAPNQRTWIIHMFNGDSYRVFDGQRGWFAGPDSPAPIVSLVSGNLDRARIEAGLLQRFGGVVIGHRPRDDRPCRARFRRRPRIDRLRRRFHGRLCARLRRWRYACGLRSRLLSASTSQCPYQDDGDGPTHDDDDSTCDCVFAQGGALPLGYARRAWCTPLDSSPAVPFRPKTSRRIFGVVCASPSSTTDLDDYWSRKLRILRERDGCLSLRKAFASIWRMRSRVTENCCPTSSSV